MSTPLSSDTSLSIPKQLRRAAENSLKDNTTPPSIGSPLSPDVLTFLYQTAATQEGNTNALRLIHEFQVHQVELDLQFKQLEDNEQALNKRISYYQSLFELAPAGYLVTDIEGQIKDANESAADVLGVAQAEMNSFSIYSFLKPKDKPLLQDQLKVLEDKLKSKIYCELSLICQDRGTRDFLLTANLSPESETVFMLLQERVSSIDF